MVDEATEEKKTEEGVLINETPVDYKEEVIETSSCKFYMNTFGDIEVECVQPTEKIKISKKEIAMMQGLSDIVPNAEK